MNLFTKEKETYKHKEHTVIAKGKEWWRRDGLGFWDQQMQTIIYQMDKQDPTVQHRELYSLSCDKS